MSSPFTVLRPAPSDLAEPLFALLSSADRTELSILASNEGTPVAIILNALQHSSYSFCYMLDGTPVAMGGIVHAQAAAQSWMIASTPILSQHKKSFLQASQAEIAFIREAGLADGLLRVSVDRRWRKSLKWLGWLGFVEVDGFMFRGREAVVMEWRQ